MGANLTGRYKISNCELPSEAQRAIKFELNFPDGDGTTINLVDFFRSKTISFAQTLYFYNPSNIGVDVSINDTGQRLFIPPLKGGYIPIMVGEDGIIQLTPQGIVAQTIDFHVINVPIYPVIFDVVSNIL